MSASPFASTGHPVVQPGFKMPPMGMARPGSPAASPQRPQITHAKPDAMRQMAQQAHQENATAGIAPQPVQPAQLQAGPAQSPAAGGLPRQNNPAMAPPQAPAVHPDGHYGHLQALGKAAGAPGGQFVGVIDMVRVRQLAKEAAWRAKNGIGVEEVVGGDGLGTISTRLGFSAGENLTPATKIAGMGPPPGMAQPNQGPAMGPPGAPQPQPGAQPGAPMPGQMPPGGDPSQASPGGAPPPAQPPVDPSTGQPIGGDPSMQQLPGSPGAPPPGAPPQVVQPSQVDPNIQNSMGQLMADSHQQDSPGQEIQDQLMVAAGDRFMSTLDQHRAVWGSLFATYKTPFGKSAADKAEPGKLLTREGLRKRAWQDNTGPRFSSTTDSTNVGYQTKKDHYDTGSDAWENTAQYLKKPPKQTRDHRIGKTAAVAVARRLTDGHKMAAAVGHPLVKRALARIVVRRMAKNSVDLRAMAQRLGMNVPQAPQQAAPAPATGQVLKKGPQPAMGGGGGAGAPKMPQAPQTPTSTQDAVFSGSLTGAGQIGQAVKTSGVGMMPPGPLRPKKKRVLDYAQPSDGPGVGESLGLGLGAAGLGVGATAYGLSHGINPEEAAKIHNFGHLADENIADPRRMYDEYVTRGSLAAQTHPFGTTVPNLVTAFRAPSAFHADGGGLDEVNSTYQHYKGFSEGPMSGYMKLFDEGRAYPTAPQDVQQYAATQHVPDWRKLDPAAQEKFYRGFDPWLKQNNPQAWQTKQHEESSGTAPGGWMRWAVEQYKNRGVNWVDRLKTMGRVAGVAGGVGAAGLGLWAWLRHRRQQKEQEAQQAQQAQPVEE